MLPPSGGKPDSPFSAPSRRTALLWGLRYYGFVGGLILLVVTVFVLAALVLTKPPEAEPELTAEDVARLRASAPVGPRSLELVLAPSTITILAEPEDAEVRLNGESAPGGAWRDVQLRPGYYLLSASREGYVGRDTLIELTEGAASTIALRLIPNDARVREEGSARALPTPAVTTPRQQPAETASARASTPAQPDVQPEAAPAQTPAALPATGSLAVVTDPVDARVMLNGEAVGDAPAFLRDLAAGEYEILVHAPGFAASAHFVKLEPGQQRTLRVTLEALQGTLSVLVRPWGSIYLNGRLVERDTDVLYTTSLESGFHTVEVVHPSLGRQVRTVEVRPGLTTRTVFELDSN